MPVVGGPEHFRGDPRVVEAWLAQIEEVLALFPVLAERVGALAGVLNGGQRQMLAIGRALMSTPRPNEFLGSETLQQVYLGNAR